MVTLHLLFLDIKSYLIGLKVLSLEPRRSMKNPQSTVANTSSEREKSDKDELLRQNAQRIREVQAQARRGKAGKR